MNTRMNSRIRPTVSAAAELLAKLGGQRFELASLERDPEQLYVVDYQGALETIQQLTGHDDVDVHVRGDYRPPGEYPLSRLTVVLDITGEPVDAHFG